MKILLCDDTEVRGNGNGSVEDLIYIPVSRYVASLSKTHMRATFFVDMAHYIYLVENEKGSDDLQFFQETINLLFRTGMDVQLHLHPQWLPRIYNPLERIDSRWNIGMLTSAEISFLVSKGKQILEDIGRSYDENYQVHAFKAGSWGLEPMSKVLDVMTLNGIDMVIGPCGNIKIDSLGLDYSRYRGEFGFVKYGKVNIALMSEVAHSPLDILQLFFERIKRKKKSLKSTDFSAVYNPLESASLFYYSRFKYVTHLRMNWQSSKYVVRMILRLIRNSKNSPYIYIETHTKDFDENQFHSPEYLDKKLSQYNCQFITVTELRNDCIRNT